MEKRQHVEPDGTYVKHGPAKVNGVQPPPDKGHYLTMMSARVALVATASVSLARAATIAIRFNAVRKQGFKNTGSGVSYLRLVGR
jgi:hypothetical protein